MERTRRQVRDITLLLIGLFGYSLIGFGIYQIYKPAAWIFAGLILTLARGSKPLPTQEPTE